MLVLEHVRLLTNLETDKEKLLRILLVGQPELAETLAQPQLRQVASRITARYQLEPLSEAETRGYIEHRLRIAGGNPGLFSGDGRVKDIEFSFAGSIYGKRNRDCRYLRRKTGLVCFGSGSRTPLFL